MAASPLAGARPRAFGPGRHEGARSQRPPTEGPAISELAHADTDRLYAVLHASHDRLVALVATMSADDVTAPSYASEWTIAQVMSHLGSGAEIFTLIVQAGRRGEPLPGSQKFQLVWDRWNAMSPDQQAREGLASDAGLLQSVDSLTDSERHSWHAPLFGREQRLADVLRLRLGEHALHSWDIAVALDPSATVSPDAVELLIDGVPSTVARAGRRSEEPQTVLITTDGPPRRFLLEIDGDGARAAQADSAPDGTAELDLTAEALLRLVAGRLDAGHTPPLRAEGIAVADLRAAFPGY